MSNGAMIVEALVSLSSLEDKVALVAGAAAGVGKACGVLLAKAGASVIAADADVAAASQAASAIKAGRGQARAIEVDVASEPSVVALFRQVRDALGRLDILVNAATAVVDVPLVETTAEQWDRAHAINLRGAFLCTREAVALMLEAGHGGRIINITTIGAEHPVLHGNGAYSSAPAVLFLAGPAARYITGQTFAIDGGFQVG